MTTQNDRPTADWIETLSRNRLQVAYALFGLALAFAVTALVVVLRTKLEYAVPLFLLVLSALLAVGTGVWQMTRLPSDDENSISRVLALGVGGYLGLLISLFGLYMMWLWRATILGGTEQWQGEKGWQVWTSLAVFFVGLAIMFVSFLVGRTEERANATIRRIIYAYNAVLSVKLVGALLIVVNILGYLYLPLMSDWTAGQLYTLSSKSKNTLQSLDKPVQIRVLQSGDRPLVHSDLRNLLENSQSLTSKLDVDYLMVHRQLRAVNELVNKYQLGEREGVLIVYGTEPNVQHRFIKETDLFDQSQSRSKEGPRYTFKGEDAVVSAIESLSQGSKPVVYFTQGNGELELDEMEAGRPDVGLNALRERLEKANYEVKGLQFQSLGAGKKEGRATVVSAKVPEDATIVIVAGPRRKMSTEALAALTEYMNRVSPKTNAKAGKLVVLLDVVTNRDGTMVETGLEKWLEEYNVEAGSNRVLTALRDAPHPTEIIAAVHPARRGNPITSAFRQEVFLFQEARAVRPRAMGGSSQNQPRFRVEELLVAVPPSWADSNLRAEAKQYIQSLIENNVEELKNRIAKEQFVPLVVAVSEGGDVPNDPAHRGVMPTDVKPRMVVFGDATLAANATMAVGSGKQDFDFFRSCLAWLSERPQSIGIEAKKRDTYAMDQGTDLIRLIFLPLILMAAGVLGFGAGVWVVRRK